MPIIKDKKKRVYKNLSTHQLSFIPKYTWRKDESERIFCIPFNHKVMYDGGLKLFIQAKRKNKLCWADVFKIYKNESKLPSDSYMKNVTFGYIPHPYPMVSNSIFWGNATIDMHSVRAIAFKGKVITGSEYNNTYNPYKKYNQTIVRKMAHYGIVQESFPLLVQAYKKSGAWNEIRNTIYSIYDATHEYNLDNFVSALIKHGGKDSKMFLNIPKSISNLHLIKRISYNNELSMDDPNQCPTHRIRLRPLITSDPSTEKQKISDAWISR